MFYKIVQVTLIFVFVVYLLIISAFWFGQSALIYPDQGTDLVKCDLPLGAKLFNENIDNTQIDGIFTLATKVQGPRKVLVFFHGNAESACSWRFAGVNHLSILGYDTLVVEYPGYAGLTGKPSLKRNTDMIDALVNWIAVQKYENVSVIGYSLGSGIASMLTNKTNVDSLILFAPYDKLSNVVRDIAPIMPSFLIHQNYKNDVLLSNFKGPVTIIHGANDDVIKPKRSEALARHLHNVERIVIPNTGHHGLFKTEFFDQLLKEKLP